MVGLGLREVRISNLIRVETEEILRTNFADRVKLESHYHKHGGEFGGIYKGADEYLDGAKDVINNGVKVQYEYKGGIRTG